MVPVDLSEEEEARLSTYKLYDWCKANGISLRVISDVSPIDERIKRLTNVVHTSCSFNFFYFQSK